jgi:hypothetical protein
MNKILIALVLAVVMSGNAYSDKILMRDGNLKEPPSYEECKRALLKGDILHKGTSGDGANIFSIHYKDYLYNIVMGGDDFFCHKFDNFNR